MAEFEKYIDMAKKLGMTDALIISPADICFDIRVILKCCWGCEQSAGTDIRCDDRGTTLQERIKMIQQYKNVLLLHAHDAGKLSKAILELEREAFLDGYYFACAVRTCRLCRDCNVLEGKDCPQPEKVRPCDGIFSIDVYKTVRQLGLPCEVLQNREDKQNRYGFLLLE